MIFLQRDSHNAPRVFLSSRTLFTKARGILLEDHRTFFDKDYLDKASLLGWLSPCFDWFYYHTGHDAASINIWHCFIEKNNKSNLKTVRIDSKNPSLATYSLLSAYEKVNFIDYGGQNKLPLIFR